MLTPLPTDEQTRAMRYVHYVRADWDPAGIRDALTQLDPHVSDPAELLIVMLEWARAKDSRLPAGVIGYVKSRNEGREAVVRRLPQPPRPADPRCPECGSTIRDDKGRCPCQFQVVDEARIPQRTPRLVSKPPAGVAEEIERHRQAWRERQVAGVRVAAEEKQG
jgi:hypothetical protein